MAEDRTQEAIDHLQLAALELIAAIRAVLDVAEEAIREPQALRDVVAATARAASQAAGAAAGRAATAEPEQWLSGLAGAAREATTRRATKAATKSRPKSAPARQPAVGSEDEAAPSAPAGSAKRARPGVEHISIT